MTQDSASLDGLHDIVLPPDVPWWPLATGWYVVAVAFIVIAVYFIWRFRAGYLANAYRREALRQLAHATDRVTIAEILRRTALAIVPRAVIAEKSGQVWLDWLSHQCPEALMPDEVRSQLAEGVYQGEVEDQNPEALRAYARFWIKHHHVLKPRTAASSNSP